MLTLCNTIRGRIACGLGGLLVAVLALTCLWAFSPSVTASDEPPKESPKEKLPKPPICSDSKSLDHGKPDETSLPPRPAPVKPADDPATPLPPIPDSKAATKDSGLPKPVLTGGLPLDSGPTTPPAPPPSNAGAKDPVLTNPAGPVLGTGTPPPPLAPTPPVPPPGPAERLSPPPTVPPPVNGSQEIKQLMAQLAQIRADRDKLDEQERQTIQTIKRKYQEQKRSLEQMERELRQLGIDCDEVSQEKGAVRPTVHSTKKD
jgi:hypothetical protein